LQEAHYSKDIRECHTKDKKIIGEGFLGLQAFILKE
jgi:hypothetical protein